MSLPPPVDQSRGVDFTGRDRVLKDLLNSYAQEHGPAVAKDDWAEWRNNLRQNDANNSDMAAELAHATFILAVDFIGPTLNRNPSCYDMAMIYRHVDRYRAAQVRLECQMFDTSITICSDDLTIIALALIKAELSLPATFFPDDQLRLFVDTLAPWMTEADLRAVLHEKSEKLHSEFDRLRVSEAVQAAVEAEMGSQIAVLVEGLEKTKAIKTERKQQKAAAKAARKKNKADGKSGYGN